MDLPAYTYILILIISIIAGLLKGSSTPMSEEQKKSMIERVDKILINQLKEGKISKIEYQEKLDRFISNLN